LGVSGFSGSRALSIIIRGSSRASKWANGRWIRGTTKLTGYCSDILHPNRPNISKEELREKLGGMYKAQKEQISVFGLRTQFGGGKTTGFALVYDSPEAMKKFEPNYRLVRVAMGTKVERASRQQRAYYSLPPPQDRGDVL
jgi:ribosomal protein S24E